MRFTWQMLCRKRKSLTYFVSYRRFQWHISSRIWHPRDIGYCTILSVLNVSKYPKTVRVHISVQFSSVQSLDRLGRRGHIRDDLAEIVSLFVCVCVCACVCVCVCVCVWILWHDTLGSNWTKWVALTNTYHVIDSCNYCIVQLLINVHTAPLPDW